MTVPNTQGQFEAQFAHSNYPQRASFSETFVRFASWKMCTCIRRGFCPMDPSLSPHETGVNLKFVTIWCLKRDELTNNLEGMPDPRGVTNLLTYTSKYS